MYTYPWSRRDDDYRMPRTVADEAERRLSTIRGAGRGVAAFMLLRRLMRCHTADGVVNRSFSIARPELAAVLGISEGMIRGAIQNLIDHGFLERITVGTPTRKRDSPKYEPVQYRLTDVVLKPVKAILAARRKAASDSAIPQNQNLRNRPKDVHSGERNPCSTFRPKFILRTVNPEGLKGGQGLEKALARIERRIIKSTETIAGDGQ